MRFLPLSLLVHALGCWAIHESDVGVVDWYKSLIGVPLAAPQFTTPKFTSVEGKDVILTATESNILAALNVDDGSIRWRVAYDPEDRITGFYQNSDALVTLSGPGGAISRSIDLKTGQIIFEQRLHSNSEATIIQPHVAFDPPSQDIYTLSNGYVVTRLDQKTGAPAWSWSGQDQSSLTTYTHLLATPDTIFAIGVSTSFASYTLHITSLSASTGEVLASSELPSSIHSPAVDLFAFAKEAPVVAWLEQGKVKSLALTPNLRDKKAQVSSSGPFEELVDVGLPGVLVGKAGQESTVLSFDGSKFTSEKVLGEHDVAVKYAGSSVNGKRYVAKSEGPIIEVTGLDSDESAILFPYDADDTLSHYSIHTSSVGVPRVLAVTTSGAMQLFVNGELKWTREEGLTTASLAEFVELPERISAEGEATKDESLAHRLQRHAILAQARLFRELLGVKLLTLTTVQDFPQYLKSFVRRFVTGSYASATSSAVASNDGALSRDAFGFRQMIVTVTLLGKVYGIDSSNGNVLWSQLLGTGILPFKVFSLKTVSDGVEPEVVIVAVRQLLEGDETVVFHLNALTGENLAGPSVFRGSIAKAFLLDQSSKFVVLVDETLKVHYYPNNGETRTAFKKVHSTLSFPMHLIKEREHSLAGYQFAVGEGEQVVATPAWSLPLSPGEEVQRILPPSVRGPVASVGKVLGNRTTLYKYLNPRLFTALTVTSTKNLCGLYLFDSAKGTVVYQVQIPADNGACDVKAALIENWLVYHYYENEVSSGNVQRTKGYRVVSVELYEGRGIDDKIGSSDMTSYANASTAVFTFEDSFIFPHALTALAPTNTKFGISSKDLMVATKNHKVQSFPRRLLDPRRPRRKPTSQEAEEGLFQYDPIIYDDPKRVISHSYEVANVRQLVTAPALLESTSLVFAFGLDMFVSRVAPSGTFDVLSESFNKPQLVLTITGLAIAIIFTRPMVQRKRLREKWYM